MNFHEFSSENILKFWPEFSKNPSLFSSSFLFVSTFTYFGDITEDSAFSVKFFYFLKEFHAVFKPFVMTCMQKFHGIGSWNFMVSQVKTMKYSDSSILRNEYH